MINSLRGMNDLMPPHNEPFEYFLTTASTIAKRYGFAPIWTPLLEESALFKRSVGGSSDIVNKEMYQFVDKGDHDVCLRPEGTAGVVRAFLQKKLDRAGGTHRYFYSGAMFRYERPQKGRLRQFHQFGVESFGIGSVYEDAAIIMMLCDIFNALGINYKIKINSIGDDNCMPHYKKLLLDFLEQHSEICSECHKRKTTNPIRVLDCKNSSCQKIYTDAPKLLNHLCLECKDDLDLLKKILDKNSILYEVDPHLVRGLDYYNKSAFEFISDEIGAQSAIAGGGRYDKLSQLLGGRSTSAVGAAIGIERVLDLIVVPTSHKSGYYIGAMDEESLELAFRLAHKKRAECRVDIDYKPRSLKTHLKNSAKLGARYCAVIGEDERNSGKIWIKDLEKKSEMSISIDEF